MARESPLRDLHEQSGVLLSAYGPPEAGVGVADAFTYVEAEYATIRKAAAVLDQPNRAIIEIRGGDRIDFLQRMITQDVSKLGPLSTARSFWLNRKGRIDADLRIINLGDRLLFDLDVLAVGRTLEGLGKFIITEDVELIDLTESTHRLALHGPGACELLSRVSGSAGAAELEPGRAMMVAIAGAEVIADREDATGDIGLELTMPTEAAAGVYAALAEMSEEAVGAERRATQGKARRAGWHAFNIARIEAGTPLYNIDFGPDNLPHESGVLSSRVSFTKGCYLGQEVVARMQSLGHPKQRLVGLLPEEAGNGPREAHPATACAVFATGDGGEEGGAVGGVTSATISPMRGGRPVCFAMVRYAHTQPGTRLAVETVGADGAPGGRVTATVQPTLEFWKRP